LVDTRLDLGCFAVFGLVDVSFVKVVGLLSGVILVRSFEPIKNGEKFFFRCLCPLTTLIVSLSLFPLFAGGGDTVRLLELSR
jgi:hypothetical protein